MEKTLLDYWYILYKKRFVLALVVMASALTALLVSMSLTSVYEAKAVFFIPSTPDVLTFLDSQDGARRYPVLPFTSEEIHTPFVGMMESKRLRELVQEEFSHKSTNDIKKDVDFRLSNEYMIEVFARDGNAKIAADLANSFVAKLNILLNEYSLSLTKRNRTIIEEELNQIGNKLNNARESLKKFQEQYGAVDLEEEKRLLFSHKADFSLKMKIALVGQKENARRIIALQQELENEAILLNAMDFSIYSSYLEDLKKNILDLEVKMAALKIDLRENHPEYVILQKQHEEISRTMNEEIKRIIHSNIKSPSTFHENLRQQVVNLYITQQQLAASIKSYEVIIQKIGEKINNLPSLFLQSDQFFMDIERYKSMHQTLERTLEENIIQNKREMKNVVMLDMATPPEKPSFPVVWFNGLIAALGGFIGGIFLIFFLAYLEATREDRILPMLKRLNNIEKAGIDD